MSEDLPQRRLAALMFTDLVGYSALSGDNEDLAIRLLHEHRKIMRRIFPVYGGIENKTIGDAFFIEFGSAIEAVRCAVEMQTAHYERNLSVPKEEQIIMRVGLHVGDVVGYEGDSFGSGVNIASRVEGQAPPGGVCLTRDVFEQVKNHPVATFKKQGLKKFKNIKESIEIYKVVFPWEVKKKKSREFKLNEVLRKIKPLMARFVLNGHMLLYSLILFSLFSIFINQQESHKGEKNRDIASQEKTLESPAEDVLFLKNTWEVQFEPDSEWIPVGKDKYQYMDLAKGYYKVRTSFEWLKRMDYPALVLGIIRGRHRVFLNQKFVGGGEGLGKLYSYNFDQDLLKAQNNELVVEIESSPNLMPALNFSRAYISNLEYADKLIRQDDFSYQTLKSIYLIVCLMLLLSSFLYYLFHTASGEYLYYTMYLFSGALLLTYYNQALTNHMSFEVYRSLKILSVMLGSMSLCLIYLKRRDFVRIEKIVNVLSIIFWACSTYFLLNTNVPSEYLSMYNYLFLTTTVLTAFWVVAVGFDLLGSLFSNKKKWDISEYALSYKLVCFVFGLSTAFLAFASIKSGFFGDFSLSNMTRQSIMQFTTASPFLFSCYIICLAVLDYSNKSRVAGYIKSKDDLVLSVFKDDRKTENLELMLKGIQEDTCQFLKAMRSTVYLKDEGNEDFALKLNSVVGESHYATTPEIANIKESRILSYVWESRSPLLIRNIEKDLRFSNYLEKRSGKSKYSGQSCMIFPLVCDDTFLGVFSLADKDGSKHFGQRDFELMHLITSYMSLNIRNHQLKKSAG